MPSRWSPLTRCVPLVGLAALAIVLKVPSLHTGAYWDELAWLSQARWLAAHHLIQALPGLRPASAFWGHPPGLHITIAAIWKVTGVSLPIAHGLIACFAAVAACGVFLFGRLLYGAAPAMLAALALLLSPLFLAQAGMFLADVPITALGVLAVYFAFRNRYMPYVVCASYQVLLKETAIALVAALAVYRLVGTGRPTRASLVDALKHCVPLAVIGSFFVLQKIATGHFFFIYDFPVELFEFQGPLAWRQAALTTRWIFVEQQRWIFSAAIALNLALTSGAIRRPEVRFFGLVVLLSGYSFSILLWLPRYLLPVLPFFYVFGVASLLEVARFRLAKAAASAGVLALMIWSLLHQPAWGNGEVNLTYRQVVGMHRALADTIAARFPDARILTTWPLTSEFSDPLFGYVVRPLRVVRYRNETDLDRADLVGIAKPGGAQVVELQTLARRRHWRLAERRQDGPYETELYVRPPRAAAPGAGGGNP